MRIVGERADAEIGHEQDNGEDRLRDRAQPPRKGAPGALPFR